MFNYGLYKGDKFYSWIGDVLSRKTGDPDITFQQLKDRYNRDLIITGSNLSRRKLEIYSPMWTPDMPVRKAVRISMSIPLFFQPVIRNDTETDTPMYLVDGGLLENYPMTVFQQHGTCYVLDETIGFKLLGENEKADQQIYHGIDKIDGITKMVKSLVRAMMLQIERLYIKKNYWERTVAIPTGDVSATDFDMDDSTKSLLYEWGYDACNTFFQSRTLDQ